MTEKTEKKDTKAAEPSGKITKDMNIGEIAMNHPETLEVFMKHGLHCIGCAAAHFENLEQGCMAHGIDVDVLVKDLNKALKKGKEGKDKQ